MQDLGIEFTANGEGERMPDKEKNTPEEITAATDKCGGAAIPTVSPAELKKLREQAACMRSAGITGFKDPTSTGEAVPDDALEKQLESAKGKQALIECGITAADPGEGENAGG